MRRHDLPAVVELLEVHCAGSHHRLLGAWKGGRPPSKGECEIRLQQLHLNSFGLDEPHRDSIGVPIDVGIMKLLPAIKLLRVNDDQQFGRFPVGLHVSLDVVGVPTVEHFDHDLVHLLGIWLGNI